MNYKKNIGAIALVTTLAACSADDAELGGSETGVIIDPNTAPAAAIRVIEGAGPLSVTLSGEESSDSDSDALSYEWIIGIENGSGETIRLNGSVNDYVFPVEGVYELTLVVTDDQGLQSSETVRLQVGGDSGNTDTGGGDGGTSTGGGVATGGGDGNSDTGGGDGNSDTGGGDGNSDTGGGDGNSETSGDDENSDTGGGDGNSDTGGGDGNSDTGGGDGNSDTGGGDGNSDTGGGDGNSDTGGDDGNSDTGGDDGNSDTGGDDGNSDTGGDDGNSDTGGDDGNADTGGEDGGTDTGGEEGSDPQVSFAVSIAGLNVDVDASATIEGSDNPHTYVWTTSNGENVEGLVAGFNFPAAGDYTILLTVTDTSTGRFAELSQTVSVDVVLTGSVLCQDPSVESCFDFEDGLPDALAGQTSNTRSLDTSVGYKSDSSLKVTTSSSQDGQFFGVAPPSEDFWARVFVRSSGDTNGGSWGGDAQGFARAHGTLLRGLDGQGQLRIGDHRCQLELNRDGGQGHLGDDLEMTSGRFGDDGTVCRDTFGARMKPNAWYCLEVHFNAPEFEFQVFWDNQNVQQLHMTAERTWTNDDKAPGGTYSQFADELWGPYNFDTFQFGYESYTGNKPTVTHWYDGVALSDERIGCGDDYVINEQLDASTMLDPQDNGYPYNGSGSGNGEGNTGGTDGGADGGTDGGGPDDGGTMGEEPVDAGEGTLVFAEDFESYSDTAYPDLWNYFVAFQSNLDHNPATYLDRIMVQSTDANSGNQAVRLINDYSNVEPVQIAYPLDPSKFDDSLYVRMYIKQSVDLGRSPANNHATLVALRGSSGSNDVEVRFGDAKGVLGINVNPTDGIAPVHEEWASQLSASDLASAPQISKDEWHCLELAFLDGGEQSQMFVWNDNNLVFSVESTDDFAPGGPTEAHWLAKFMQPTNGNAEIVIGWQSWQAGSNDTILVDDVVASTGRVGCDL